MIIFKIMGSVIGVLIFTVLGFGGYGTYQASKAFNPTKNSKDLESRIDKAFNNVIEKDNSTGVAIALYKNDTVLIKTYGLKDKKSGEAIDTNTIFEIGSISKVFTTSLLQMTVDAGLVKLQDDIRQYLPDSINYGFEHSISLEQLATHTSGLPKLPMKWFEDSLVVNNCNPYTHLNFDSIVSYLENPTEMGTQGEVAYSNLGNGLIGHILENVHNKGLNELLDSMIFKPLAMDHSGIETDSSLKHLLATGYDAAGKRSCNWQFPILSAAGAIESNIPDMLAFLKANLDNTYALYSSFSKCHTKRASNITGDFGPGWMIGLDMMSEFIFKNSKNFIHHNGGTGGFRSAIVLDKKSNNGIIVLSSGEKNILADAVALLNYANTISLK